MAYSKVPDSQTLATQVPRHIEAGERVFAGPTKNSVPERQDITTAAAAGSTTSNATVLAKVPLTVVTGGDATKGVRLPVLPIGESMEIHNQAAAVLKLYPPTGGKINGGSTDASVNVAANSRVRAISITATEISV